MNSVVIELTRSITGKHSLSECSVEELEQLTRQYPYFGPAQLLLARKLKEENASQYEEQQQRALLYFREPLWFDYVCGEDDQNGMLTVSKETEPTTENNTLLPGITATGKTQESSAPALSLSEETVVPGSWGITVETEETIPAIAEAGPAVPAMPAEEVIEPLGSDELHPAASTSEPEPGPAIKFPSFSIEPAGNEEQALVFEPYHTVDYFASQGIRTKEEDKPRDRFSQQLRSFTEWLKTMKRLPDGQQPATTQDTQIEQMAEHSITDREVVTEAMASVWEQQGIPEKAIAIYQKLSLLNPSKSAYFAAKIEHLKHL